jgi:hypothetical protein
VDRYARAAGHIINNQPVGHSVILSAREVPGGAVNDDGAVTGLASPTVTRMVAERTVDCIVVRGLGHRAVAILSLTEDKNFPSYYQTAEELRPFLSTSQV